MSFLDDARVVLQGTLPDILRQTEEYVPRILVRDGTDCQEAGRLRILRRFGSPELEGKLLLDTQVADCPRLAIIGDAGSGKSYILQFAYLRAAYTFLSSPDASLPCLLDLARHLSIQHSVEEALLEALNRRYGGLFTRLRSEHQPGCVLFLDALDERLLNAKNPFDFVNGLLYFLKDYRDILRGVVLTCRRVTWNPDWLRNSESPWEVYHADYLDFEDYAHIIPDIVIREAFFGQASSLGIADLLRLPFIGFDLAHKYKEGQSLPQSRRDWFQGRIKVVLKGSERDQELGQSPPTETLLFLARQLACLATFSRTSGWTVHDAIDQLAASKILQEELSSVGSENIRILFQRPLFTKTDNCFSFSHQLFREYLAAESLSTLPLRKQRQLLESALPSLQHRILTPFRGIAIFLAEMSSRFCEYLIENDPLIAFLADCLSLPPEIKDKLIRRFIDGAIAQHRAPWWGVPPRGERPSDFLPKHRPTDIASFLHPYLKRPDEVPLLWATACAAAWGGSIDLNNQLNDLAHSDTLNVEIRKNAVDAVFASKEAAHIRRLYDLLDSEDDQVRGHVLHAYRMTESPAPGDYISKLYGGAHNHSLICFLQSEVSSFGLALNGRELREAFQEALSHLAELDDLSPRLLQGLFQRAFELDFEDISPSLIVKSWLVPRSDSYYGAVLRELICRSPNLFKHVWNYVLNEFGQENPRLIYHSHELSDHLAEVCSDQVFDLLPSDRNALNRAQDTLISYVLRSYFYKEPTAERLEKFKRKAPSFTAHFQLPQPTSEPSHPDLLEAQVRVAEILDREKPTVYDQTSAILGIVAGSPYRDNHQYWVEPTKVIEFLKEFPVSLRQRVLKTFEACALHTDYSRSASAQADGTHRVTITLPRYAVPFWVARHFEVAFPASKIDEIIRCYAFSDFPPNGPEPEMYFRLLDELHSLDSQRWSDTVFWLTECPDVHLYGPLEYLASRESDLYVETCRQRLKNCHFAAGEFNSLFNYWIARRPPDYEPALRTCYEYSDREEDRTELLYVLLTEDSDWAWEELNRRINAGNPPRREPSFPRRPLRLPLNSLRLPVLVDWYAHLRRTRDEAEADWTPGDIEVLLKEAIIAIGGEEAITELKRLQRQRAFPGAEWLSGSILRIEDQMLSVTDTKMDSGQLIDFVNRDALGVVLNERDLFEWICQAIEDTQERLERQAAQVHGYWNRHGEEWEPKTEPECQNVFWPTIADRLANLGFVGVEERTIRADRVDFWVEKPLSDGQPAHVAIELKVARKGYGYKDLVTPLETQLWQKYLEPSGCKHGIYVVLWFKDSARYPYPTRWETPSELLGELQDLKRPLTQQHSISIACYVIDMTTATRIH